MDTATIFQITTIVFGCVFVVLLLIHIGTPSLRGMRNICAAYALATAGMQMLSLRGHASLLFSLFLGQLFLSAINIFIYRALLDLLRLQMTWLWFAFASLLPVCTITPWYIWVHPRVVPPILVLSIVLLLQNAMLCALISRNGSPHTLMPRRMLAVLFGAWGAAQLLRAFLALTLPEPSVFPIARSFNAFIVLVPILAGVLTSLALLWLAMSKLQRDLELESRTDSLTGLLNRRALDLTVTREIARARRARSSLAVILLDLDGFKSINDRYGHDAGDFALSIVAAHFSKSLRNIDLIGRLGGEEFVIFLPDAATLGASEIAERLRVDLQQLAIRYNNQEFNLSASFGVTQLVNEDLTWEDTLRRADRALYRAKDEGRNRIVIL